HDKGLSSRSNLTRKRTSSLELRPIEGLLPLGPDPVSGLQEFANLFSGEPAVRDPGSGKLLLNERSGIVQVLIPGGSFWMGAQKSDPKGPNYDPGAQPDESDEDGRPVRIELDPFFLSKYEMTQGQWPQIAGANPSIYGPDGTTWATREARKPVMLLHPVGNVSWDEYREMLARLDLVLPTEAQWEYAARANSDTPWWTGRDKKLLSDAGNLLDGFCKRNGGHPSWRYDEELDDGFMIHAPVGSLRANAFGLFDVVGNVFEWCRDGCRPYSRPARAARQPLPRAPRRLLARDRVGRALGVPRLAPHGRPRRRPGLPPLEGHHVVVHNAPLLIFGVSRSFLPEERALPFGGRRTADRGETGLCYGSRDPQGRAAPSTPNEQQEQRACCDAAGFSRKAERSIGETYFDDMFAGGHVQ
ncbi:MAG: formylglycine-generating enzyme family protein, partial [Planctomycetota bacterium]